MKFLATLLMGLSVSQTVFSAEVSELAVLTDVHAWMDQGEYDKAEKRLLELETPRTLRLRMELADRRGDRATAELLATRLIERYQRGALRDADDMAQAAVGFWRLDRWQDANQVFLEASELPRPPASLYVDWGNLYLRRYNPSEAQAIFEDAVKAGPDQSPPRRWGPAAAYLGLVRALDAQGAPGAEEALKKAVGLNPDDLDLISHQAYEAIQGADWDEAAKFLEKGLKKNPNHARLLQLKAAYHYLQRQEKEFEKARDQALAINPLDADLYETLGDVCIPNRRLEAAIDFYREAVRLNPRQWSAQAALGINLLRVGRETEGKQVLELAYENDPFNLWTVNTLRLLDSFVNFTRFETPHFQAKIQTSEVHALRPYVSDLLERSLTSLAHKYRMELSGKYVFEMYANHEDFAVRTLGMPGLGALGATFGRVVAMDSPTARPGGKFHWGSTLWHEVAHIVTLALSDQKVPRWFTEGLSMMEERHSLEGWGDFLSLGFVKAYEEGKLLPLEELDEGFQKPKFPGQIELSYFQAGWVCDFLSARYGAEKIRAMLVAYGQDKTSAQVFEEVLGASIEDVGKAFQEEMDKTLKPLLPKLRPPPGLEGESGLDGTLAAGPLVARPDNYFVNVRKGRQLLKDGKPSEAAAYLKTAIEIFPTEAGEESPYALLVEAARAAGDDALRLEALRAWWKAAPRFAESGMELAGLLRAGGHRQEAIGVLEGVMFVNPLKYEAHRELGELYLQADRAAEAEREFRTLVEMSPPDIAGARFHLAKALAETGQTDKARREVLLALEIAPGYADAQKLLLKLVKP